MPNILKRPMFRRGGSVAEGTGITSGLTSRRARYEEGTSDQGAQTTDNIATSYSPTSYSAINIPGAVSQGINVDPNVLKQAFQSIKQQIEPSGQQRLSDFLTAFGASGAGIPAGQKQTLTSALGRAAQTVQQEEQKRQDLANKYAAEGDIALLRGVSKQQNDLLATRARTVALNPSFRPDITDPQKRYEAAYNQEFSSLYNPFKKDISPQAYAKAETEKIHKETGVSQPAAGKIQSINAWIEANKNSKENVRGQTLGSLLSQLDPYSPDLTGTKLVRGKDADTYVPTKKGNFINENVYYDPQEKALYQYHNVGGKGEFTRLYVIK
jgi:hypothetical protein